MSEPASFDGPAYDPEVTGSAREEIISLLSTSPVEIDDLIRESGQPAGTVLTVLLELEIAGRLQLHPGQMVSLV